MPDDAGSLWLEHQVNEHHRGRLIPEVIETGVLVKRAFNNPPPGGEFAAADLAQRFQEVEQSVGALGKSVRRQIDDGSAASGDFDFPEQIYAVDRLQDAAEELSQMYASSGGGGVALGNPAKIVAERCERLRAHILGKG